MIIFHSVESVLVIIIMFMTGFFMTRAGWLNDSIGSVFSKIILNLALPCYMIWNLMTTFSKKQLLSLIPDLAIPFMSIGISYLIGIAVSELFKIPEKRKGVFRSVFFTSNTIFIGLPINLSLFGEKSVPYVLLYYIANTVFFWTLGAFEISRDANRGEKLRFFNLQTIKRILSPALLGFLAAILLILFNVKLPAFLLSSCEYFGNLTTPLAMLFIGIVLSSVPLRKLRPSRDVLLLLIARFLVCPLIVIILTIWFHVPSLAGKVFVIQAAMPAMTSTGVVAKEYGADYEFGTIVCVITTIVSMLAIPLYMAFI